MDRMCTVSVRYSMRLCLLATVVLMLNPFFVRAGEGENQILQQILQQLNEVNARFDSIEKRLDTLETEKGISGKTQVQSGEPAEQQGGEMKEQAVQSDRQEVEYLREDVDEIFERLDVTEKKSLMDKLNLGVTLRTRVDNMEWEDKGAGFTDHNDNFWSSRFRLRMGADVSEQLKFHGRMSVYKNWSDADYNAQLWDGNISERPSDTTVRLDRAYVDLIFSDFFIPIAFTVGRQPTVGGVPDHLKDDTAARSTYPSLSYDRETDAICMTLGLSNWTGWQDSAFRIMYGKFLQPDNDSFLYLDDKGDDIEMLWLQAETRLPGNWKNTSTMLTYIRNWNMSGAPFEAVTVQPGNLGYNEVAGVTLLSENILDIGLDLFFSYSYSKAYSSGNTIMADMNGDGTPERYGMLSNDGMGDHSGDAFYTGFKYRLPFAFLNEAKIGLEYNHGSQYWWSPTIGSNDPFNKLATRGDAWEIYFIQPLIEHALIRVGWLGMNYDYVTRPAPIGEPGSVDQSLQTLYMLLDVSF